MKSSSYQAQGKRSISNEAADLVSRSGRGSGSSFDKKESGRSDIKSSKETILACEDDEMQNIIDSIVDEKFILNLTGLSNVEEVNHLKMKINTNTQSIYVNSSSLPNLATLNLDGSIINSVRDLGVGFRNLFALSINECGLTDLDGVGVLIGLESLSICNNLISDLSPLAMHDNLKKLNATGNNLRDLSFADSLSSCPKLYSVAIAGNPIAMYSVPNLSTIIASIITSLEQIDGVKVNRSAALKVTHIMVQEATNALEELNEEADKKSNQLSQSTDQTSATALMRASNSNGDRASRPQSATQRSGSASSALSATVSFPNIIPDTGSELTHGSNIVFAGNVVSAMRRRKSSKLDGDNRSSADGLRSSYDGKMGSPRDSFSSFANNEVNQGALSVLDAALRGDFDRQTNPALGTDIYLGEGDITKKVKDGQIKSSLDLSVEEIVDQDDQRSSHLISDNNSKSSGISKSGGLRASNESRGTLTSKNDPINDSYTSNRANSSVDRYSSSKNGPSKSTGATSSAKPKESVKLFNPFNALLVEEKANNNHSDDDEDSNILDVRAQRHMYESGSTSALLSGRSPLNSAHSTPRPSSSRGGSRQRNRSNSEDSDSMDDLVKYYKNSIRTNNDESAPQNGKSQKPKKSIVHLDIVRRNMNESLQQVDIEIARLQGDNNIIDIDAGDAELTPDKDTKEKKNEERRRKKYSDSDGRNQIIKGGESSDSDSDNNNFSISHSSRHRLMSASGRRQPSSGSGSNTTGVGNSKNTGNTRNNSNRPQGSLLVYAGPSVPNSGLDNSDPPNQNNSDSPSTNEILNNNLAHNTKIFLKHLEEDDDIIGGSNSKTACFKKSGKLLGFDLRDGLAAIDQWVDTSKKADTSMGSKSSQTSSVNALNKSQSKNNSGIVIKTFDEGDEDDNDDGEDSTMFLKRGDIVNMFKVDSINSNPNSPIVESKMSSISVDNAAQNAKSLNNSTSKSSQSNSMAGVSGAGISVGNGVNAAHCLKNNLASNSSGGSANRYSGVDGNNMKTSSKSSGDALQANFTAAAAGNTVVKSPLKTRSLKESKSELGSTAGSKDSEGAALTMSDKEIIELLKCPPKSVPVMKTKSSFLAFFKGYSYDKMKYLLENAYSGLPSEAEKMDKVSKRLELLKEVLV